MMQKPRRYNRNKQIVGKTLTALDALGKDALDMLDTPPAPEQRIESLIRYDVNPADLTLWRNDGWQVVHYQFVNNDRDLPVLAVVMERTVDVVPEPIADSTPPAAAADTAQTEDKTPPFTVEIAEGPQPELLLQPTLLEKLAADRPIFGAIVEHGAEAVIEVLDAKVLTVAHEAYHAAGAGVDTPPTRFESQLLTTGNLTPAEDEMIIEVLS